MAVCDRCHQKTHGTTMSFFNTEIICMKCSAKEREHPKFKEARDAEEAAVKAGNTNFRGIGKPPDL